MVEALFSTRGDSFSGLFSVLFSRYSAGLIMHLPMAEFTSAAGVRVIDMGTPRARAAARQQVIDVVRRHPVLHSAAGWLWARYRLARSGRGH